MVPPGRGPVEGSSAQAACKESPRPVIRLLLAGQTVHAGGSALGWERRLRPRKPVKAARRQSHGHRPSGRRRCQAKAAAAPRPQGIQALSIFNKMGQPCTCAPPRGAHCLPQPARSAASTQLWQGHSLLSGWRPLAAELLPFSLLFQPLNTYSRHPAGAAASSWGCSPRLSDCPHRWRPPGAIATASLYIYVGPHGHSSLPFVGWDFRRVQRHGEEW